MIKYISIFLIGCIISGLIVRWIDNATISNIRTKHSDEIEELINKNNDILDSLSRETEKTRSLYLEEREKRKTDSTKITNYLQDEFKKIEQDISTYHPDEYDSILIGIFSDL